MIRVWRSTVAMAVLLAYGGTASAQWQKVGEDKIATTYADPATVERIGDLAKMRSLLDYRSFQRMVEVGYFSQKILAEYDCAGRRFRGLSVALHADKMGDGKVIYADDTPHAWESVVGGTTTEALWTLACQ